VRACVIRATVHRSIDAYSSNCKSDRYPDLVRIPRHGALCLWGRKAVMLAAGAAHTKTAAYRRS